MCGCWHEQEGYKCGICYMMCWLRRKVLCIRKGYQGSTVGIARTGGGDRSRSRWPLACWDCRFESRRGHVCLCCLLQNQKKKKQNAGQSRQRNKYGWSTKRIQENIKKFQWGRDFLCPSRQPRGQPGHMHGCHRVCRWGKTAGEWFCLTTSLLARRLWIGWNFTSAYPRSQRNHVIGWP